MSSNEARQLPSFIRSKESLKLAVEFLGKSPGEQAAERAVKAAALFDAYLSGRICFSVHDRSSLLHGFSNLIRARIEVRSVSGVNNDPTVPATSSKFSQSQGSSDSPDQVFSGHTGHSSSPSSASKDARTDSTSEAGNETVAQDTQAKRPHDDTLSEQERCDRINLAVQTDIRKYREKRLTSPTDEELQKWGCPKLLDPRARMFICQLPDEDLRTIRRHAMPGWLAGLLSQIADEEIERRTGEDEASS
ncbi:hypothetical protein [Saccharibacter floricola]|uniref:Uncharacterized protein n=1 Tax=Saccharibacter floricola DSM 15669 TaxID=1123227 RepID=A0ABQ0NWF2_9PROT|nr:hypothetical protein [Saccharibacter floricola]GBQ04986.1 hypothetical protein AA15669_0251 [Saccharibacter floricola DSM 15669]